MLKVLVVDDADRAVRHRRYSDFIVHFRQRMPVKITEVTGILKRIYLPGAVLKPLIQAGDPLKQQRRMHRRPPTGYDIVASTGARSHLDAIQNGCQFRVAVHPQTPELLDQRTKRLSCRGTTPQRAVQACSNVVTHLRNSHTQRWLCWSSTPTAHLQRFPHTLCCLRYALSICC